MTETINYYYYLLLVIKPNRITVGPLFLGSDTESAVAETPEGIDKDKECLGMWFRILYL